MTACFCRYQVRVAVVQLGDPPDWFRNQAGDHLTQAQAREIAGTNGVALTCLASLVRVRTLGMAPCLLPGTHFFFSFPAHVTQQWLCRCDIDELSVHAGSVLLLTNPGSAGYRQNPISIYYCYSLHSHLQCCIAEVTNTPWGERVTFAFDPKGTVVPKALHVSPMMDMANSWCALAECLAAFQQLGAPQATSP